MLGPSECWSWSKSKLYETLIVFLKDCFAYFEKISSDKKHENYPAREVKMLPSRAWVFYHATLCFPWPRNCMLGNFSCFCCRLLAFFRINFQKHYQSVKQFGFKSGPTICKGYQQTPKVAASKERVKMLPSRVWVFYRGTLCIPWPRNYSCRYMRQLCSGKQLRASQQTI